MSALAAVACGDGGLDYEGEAGRPVAADIDRHTPYVQVAVDGSAPGRFLVDTGAPFSVLDTDSYDLSDGKHAVDLDAFGLHVFDYEVVAFDALPFPQGDRVIDGIVGGALMCSFTLSVDYQGERAWLDDAWDGGAPAEFDAAVAPAIAVDVRLDGGGRYLVPGNCGGDCGTIELPGTRILVEVVADGDAEPFTALVDTGATAVVASEALMTRLGMDGRPRLDGVTVGTASGPVTAYFTRLGSVSLSDAAEPLTSVPTLVVPGFDLFDALSDEVDGDVDAIIGGTLLRHFLVTMDYPGRQLVLSRYRDPSHIDADEFVDLGFDMVASGGAWVVGDVYSGTDAQAQGVRTGDVVVRLDGTEIAGLDEGAVRAIVTQYDVGDAISLELDRLGGPVTLSVAVEDLLPHYEVP